MALCTQSDIEALRQIDVTAEPDGTIATLISLAEGKLEGLTGRQFGSVTDEAFKVENLPEVDGVVYLPPFPIDSAAVVDADDNPYTADTDYHLNPLGRVYRLGAGTGVMTWDWQFHVPVTPTPWPAGTTIKITGGGAEDAANVPRDLRSLCAEIAALLYDKGTAPGALQSESLGGWAAGYRAVDTELDKQQMQVVRKYSHSLPVIAY